MKILLMKFFPALIVCATLSRAVYAQDFSEFIEQAKKDFESGDTARFEASLRLLYPRHIKAHYPLYEELLDAVADDDREEAFELLGRLVLEDGLLLDEIGREEDFAELHGDPRWAAFMEEVEELKSGYDNPLRLRLKDIQYRDQGIRLVVMYSRSHPLADRIHDYMRRIDAQSAREVTAVIDRVGWPGEDMVGSEGAETVFLAIQHADDLEVQQKYIPLLRQAVLEGRAEGWQLAFLTDRILMNQGKKQIYGTQKVISYTDDSESYIIPLEYPERVDSLRAEIGLEPLAEELGEYGIEWDLESYYEDLPEIERKYRQRHEAIKNGAKR
ncbi:MAG: hypothetical protein LUE10_08975 [Alistipes sp.]|nr:hypothetical protein [Alistipes sp.]